MDKQICSMTLTGAVITDYCSLSTHVHVLYLGASLGQPDDLTEIAGDVDVHSPSQVPRLHDPRVILSPGQKVQLKLMHGHQMSGTEFKDIAKSIVAG